MATIIVDTLVDEADGSITDGDISLRDAIASAASGDLIIFSETIFAPDAYNDPLVNATIAITQGNIEIDKDLTIDGDVNGDGISDVTIDGNGGNQGILTTTTGTEVNLHALTLRGGYFAGSNGAFNGGGAISTGRFSSLNISNSTFLDNRHSYLGGAIKATDTTMNIVNSSFLDNEASFGGAIYAVGQSGYTTIANSTFRGNFADEGGAFWSNQADLTIIGSTLTGNTSIGYGAGLALFNINGPDVKTISNSIIAGNGSLGRVSSDSDFDVRGSINSKGSNIFGSPVAGNTAGDVILPTSAYGLEDVFTSTDIFSVSTGLGQFSFERGALGYGGLTPNAPILPGGIAQDAGVTADVPTEVDIGIDVNGDGIIEATPISIDQRGEARVVGSAVDIGAAEVLADPSVRSTFDSNDERWLVADGGPLSFLPASGNPDGNIRGVEGSSGVWYFVAPAKFFGNQSTFYGGTLSFDLKQDTANSQFDGEDVFLSGNGITLATDAGPNPGTDWTSYSLDLDMSHGWRLGSLTGEIATLAQIQSVLADVTELRIRGEFVSGTVGDAANLDNVALQTGIPPMAFFDGVVAESTFNFDSEGWSFAGDGAAFAHVATGGNPDGYMTVTDSALGPIWYYLAAEEFVGEKSAFYGGTLSFDLIQSSLDEQIDRDDVILIGGGLTIALDHANPGTDWTSYAHSLSTASDWRIGNEDGAVATEAQIRQVLADLTSLQVRGEYKNGADTGGIDNVRMEAPDRVRTELSSGQVVETFKTMEEALAAIVTSGDQIEVFDSLVPRTTTGALVVAKDLLLQLTEGYGETFRLGLADNLEMTGEGDANVDGNARGNSVLGNEGDNEINGFAGRDTIEARGGDDVVSGGNDDDFLNGGSGNDTLAGEADNDRLFGSIGEDLLLGGAGNDTINGGGDNDTIRGEAGDNVLRGEGGNDEVSGTSGVDQLTGGLGEDTLNGGSGADELLGQGQTDILNGDAGNDVLRGGSGNDTLSGGGDDDQLFGQGNNDVLNGNAGNDTLFGAAGADQLFGNAGADTLQGGNAADTLNGGTGDDLLNGGAQADLLIFTLGSGSDTISGFEDNVDTIQLSAGLAPNQTVADILADSAITNQIGSGVVMNFGDGDVLRINNISISQLSDDMLIA